ncbi:hypothetical protein PI124_g5428 [Phytophthora idaei]|nr:hypothetical protein PI125_g5486 [Phytophthora idaei]KAG3249923.1 hypothetical protein PI124_g5428 [Phytophthora idaei]
MQTPPEQRNITNLVWHLRDAYGRRESAWEVQLRLIQRRQQPGELLRDYANSLTELGAGHSGFPGNFYVDAFARGMNNKISAQVVRTVKSPTLQQAVSFAIENCGKYEEVNNWGLAAQIHQKNATHDTDPADQLD